MVLQVVGIHAIIGHLLLFVQCSSDIKMNNVTAKYFISYFNLMEFPLSIGTCSPFDNAGLSGYQMAECIDERTVNWTSFEHSNCLTSRATTIFNSSCQTGTATFCDFNCDNNATNSYVSIELYPNTCNRTSLGILHAALGVCTHLSTPDLGVYFFCDGSQSMDMDMYMELYYFNNTGGIRSCDQSMPSFTVNATSNECGFIVSSMFFGDHYGIACIIFFCLFFC